MDSKELCENFIAADNIINGEYYGTMTMGYKTKYPNYNKHCIMSKCETDMKLDSLSEDLFDQLGTQIEDEYYEYFMMWISDKLFKIAKDNPQINDITLNEAYEKYLNKNIENWKYWSLLDIKQGLKQVNLMHMKQFYKLLNDICKTIVYYNPNKDDIEKFISNSTECYNQYSSLYTSVPKCNSYHHLLDNLKKTYENFKNSVHDKIKNEYPDLAKDLQTLTIENTNPYSVGKLKAFDFSDEKCKPQKAKEPGLSKKMEQPPGTQSASQKSGTSPQSETKDSDKGKGGSKSEKTDSGTQKGNSDSEGGGKGGKKGESGSTDDGSSGSGSPGDGANGGSKEPGDQVQTPPSGDSNRYFPNNWKISFNLTSYMPSVYGIYQSSKDILTSATNQVSNAYTSSVIAVKDTYNKTVTAVKDTYNGAVVTVKDAYTRSTNYISGAVSNITNQLSSLGSFSQLGDDQFGSGSSGNSLPTDNNPPSTTQTPKSDPNPLPPPSPSSSQTSPPLQTPLQPQSNQTQDPSSKKQPSSTHDSQDTVNNGTSNIVQQPVPNTGAGGVQTLPISQVTSLNSSTDPSSIGNGSTTGTVVKTNEKSSIWYIAQNKKYDILGIGIISISIFAFLAIMYKYLSLGYTSKSTRKKSIKKVINSIGGKRPVQIIIKSYDRNKHLKPIINSADRKKDPLLNIYKLMQADPIPFINVFFLLIFFVYKRKYDFLEL
ncbi:PIR protein CIR protein [Plasmodium vinckei brucechwatti]|uniref:PIR protein CIR protein n=1 Tax=Plasmodium vinckei brucechwatti TaxID=119398 RepID=A0A6V7RZ78_PLAVN|nr:PIR protein CIR protein [Plasmodium vinckei brucechwatti]